MFEKLQTYTGTTLVVKVRQAREALFTASASNKIAIAASRQHAFTDDTCTDRLVAGHCESSH